MMIEREAVFLACAYMCEREYLYMSHEVVVCVYVLTIAFRMRTQKGGKRDESNKRRSTNEALTSTKEALKKLNLSKA